MYQAKVVEKIETRTDVTKLKGKKKNSCRLRDNVAVYCTAGQATDDSMAHVHCMMDT
jgi:hypothetical protein